jgi:hypothetical protein
MRCNKRESLQNKNYASNFDSSHYFTFLFLARHVLLPFWYGKAIEHLSWYWNINSKQPKAAVVWCGVVWCGVMCVCVCVLDTIFIQTLSASSLVLFFLPFLSVYLRLDIDNRVIWRLASKRKIENSNGTQTTQDRAEWQAFVNTVLNLTVP